jgi:hypothetical protein
MEEQTIPCEQSGLTGRAFLEATERLSRAERETAIYDAIAGGAVPSFSRTLVDVEFAHGKHVAVVRVAADYAAIGTDEDFVRIPMSPVTAQRLADLFGLVLPTTKLVDAIYRAATVKLAPSPMTPGPQMMSNDYYRRHQETIERARDGRVGLIAGHKKDVVVTNRLGARPGRVAIYGWHQRDGRPIQPLSLVHEASYADYSHGIRFVQPTMVVNGQERPLGDVARDPGLCALVSNEGPLRSLRAAAPFG